MAALAVVAAAGLAAAQEPPKWANLDDGLKAAKRTGKPLLLVTAWKHGVDLTGDTWHERVPTDPEVAKQLWRFEQAEWQYDGLGGRVIPWTREHGGTGEDPTLQAFVVLPDTGQVTRAPRDDAFAPSAFAKWLKDQADAFEKTHPIPKLAYVKGDVRTEGEGTAAKWVCPALDAARKDDRKVLLFISRSEKSDADKTAKAQAAASKKTEKGFLDSERFARFYQGWTLIKIDLSDPDDLAFAKSYGVEKAPYYLLFRPGDEKPEEIDPADWNGFPGAKGKKPQGGGGAPGGGHK
jgi:hypothetical protein